MTEADIDTLVERIRAIGRKAERASNSRSKLRICIHGSRASAVYITFRKKTKLTDVEAHVQELVEVARRAAQEAVEHFGDLLIPETPAQETP